ncbi:MAG: hypothetical protein A3H42_01575 [Deltaproteobacteria bacterium RIFCSPLOWO2_02_FULL_46_8]|nr:MAG: hypothetical protein A3H42_01575 [Deltaproteobacteria bacterium RIFCSPLOWO2_02_FULL_46_8]
MKKTIEKMAHLARLKFPEEELNRFTKKAEHILEYIEMLKEIDTTKMEPTSHATFTVNAFREDQVQKFEKPEKIIDIAPAHDHNLFEVPQVIDEG